MPENISETDKVQMRLPKSLIDQLDSLALLGLYGSQRVDVIQTILGNEVRRLIVSGELKEFSLVKIYPTKNEDASRKDSD
jgi:hypothetical protein